MKTSRNIGIIAVCVAGLSSAVSLSSAAEFEMQLRTNKSTYLRGEPIFCTVTITTAGLTAEEVRQARFRTDEAVVVTPEGETPFPLVQTMGSSAHAYRPIVDGKIVGTFALQPAEFWWRGDDKPLTESEKRFLAPGKYTLRIRRKHLIGGELREFESNAVGIEIEHPEGRNLEAWKALSSSPTLLSLVGRGDYNPDDFGPEGLDRTAEFAKRYCDTVYGQIATVHVTMAAILSDRFSLAADLYPTLGRVIEERQDMDLVTQYGHFAYLLLDNLLEEQFDPAKGLADMREFSKSLADPPLILQDQTQRLIAEYESMTGDGGLDASEQARLEALMVPLTSRGDLPTVPEVRERRRAIALGREN
jgi:hypothetical protein